MGLSKLEAAMLFWIVGWIIYGLIVGLIAKAIHPGDKEPQGFLATVGIGVAGSFIGGGINWMLGMGGPFAPSGILMGIIGGIIFCWLYTKFELGQYLKN